MTFPLTTSLILATVFLAQCALLPGHTFARGDWLDAHAATLARMPDLAALCAANAKTVHAPKPRARKVNLSKPGTLNQSDTEYLLTTDIEAEGTAFVVTASRVTLNLGGHAIRYGLGSGEKCHGILVEGFKHQDIQIMNGRIEQARRPDLAPESAPVMVPWQVTGFEAKGLALRWNSPQTSGIFLPWGQGSIRSNILVDEGEVISNRHQQMAAINVQRAANTDVQGNAIVRTRQTGVSVGENNTTCSGNVIFIDSLDTNSFGVFYYGDKKLATKSWKCEGNVISGVGVHPIGIGVISQASNGVVANNKVDVQCTRSSKEYNKPIGAACYRTTWGADNVLVTGNTFIVRGTKGSIEGRDSWGRGIMAAINKGNSLHFINNTVKALADHPSVKMSGLAVTGHSEPGRLVFEGNDVESTWTTVLLADDYGTAKGYPVFANNVFRLSGDNGASLWLRDDYKNWVSTGLIANNTIHGVPETAFALSWDSKETKELLFGRQLEFETRDASGKGLPDTLVEIMGSDGTVLASGRTGKDGKATLYAPVRSVSNRDTAGNPLGKRQDRDVTALVASCSAGDATLSAPFDPRDPGPVTLTPRPNTETGGPRQ